MQRNKPIAMRRLATIAAVLGGAAFLSYGIAVAQMSVKSRDETRLKADESYSEIWNALTSYYFREGRFPDELTDLVPTDLSEIPFAGARSEWQYKVDERGPSLHRVDVASEYSIWMIDPKSGSGRIYRD